MNISHWFYLFLRFCCNWVLLFADIRELISLDDVMEELGLGPNGGLMYCMEYPFYSCLAYKGNFYFSAFCHYLDCCYQKSLYCYYYCYLNAVTSLYQFGLLLVLKCSNAMNACGIFCWLIHSTCLCSQLCILSYEELHVYSFLS